MSEDNYYESFIAAHYSSTVFFIVSLASIISVYSVFPNPLQYNGNLLILAVVVAIMLVTIPCVLFCIWFAKRQKHKTKKDPQLLGFKLNIMTLQTIMPVLVGITLINVILLEIYAGTCGTKPLYPLALLGLKINPLLSFFLLRDTNIWAIAIAWILCLLSMLTMSIYLKSSDLLVESISFTFVTGLIYYDSFRQSHSMCVLIEKFRGIVAENERLSVEAQALELRAMIGNVAHDLKTVRTKYMYCSSAMYCCYYCFYSLYIQYLTLYICYPPLQYTTYLVVCSR